MKKTFSTYLAYSLLVITLASPAWAVLDNGAQFTPDGQFIVFHSYRDHAGEIWIMRHDGSQAKKMTQGNNHDRWPLISSDGKKIAFVSRRSGNWDVFSMNIDGSGLLQITDTAANELGAAFSPDGQQIVYAQANQDDGGSVDLFIAQADGANAQLLVEGGVWPVWGANNQIVYGKPDNNQGGIYVFDPIKKQERLLVSSENQPSSPTWSHDGKRVYFVQNSGAKKHVFSINNDGSGLHDLGIHAQIDSRPIDSPDGRLLIWGLNRHGDTDLFVYNLTQQQTKNLTPNSFYERFPDINHQTGALVISSLRDGNGEIYLHDSQGQSHNLTQTPTSELGARWAPDGNHIAYSSDAQGVFNVYMMNVHNKQTTQLTDYKANTFVADWHPDGNRIMVSTGPWGKTSLWVLDIRNKQARPVFDTTINGTDGSFSPDGQSIAFVRNQGNASALIIKELASGKEHELLSAENRHAAPVFSPNGQQLAFSSDQDGDMEIFLINIDGSNLKQITDNQSDDEYPRWNHSGTKIYFDSNLQKNHETFVINTDGTQRKRISPRN